MAEKTYLQDRAGKIHIWNGITPTDENPWTRAICRDPGDFHQLSEYDGEITCPRCRKKLGIPTQLELFD